MISLLVLALLNKARRFLARLLWPWHPLPDQDPLLPGQDAAASLAPTIPACVSEDFIFLPDQILALRKVLTVPIVQELG